MIVAIIPARGVSKRIPRKNIKLFHGKPIIAYSIERAIESNIFDKIFVSTDDMEISEISRSFGAEIISRPAELSDDYTGIHSVMNHAARELCQKINSLKSMCCIYATAPFIQSSDLLQGLNILNNENCKSVFAASEFSYPVFRSFFLNDSSKIEMLFPEHFNSRSQDLPSVFHDAGLFSWGHLDTWLGDPIPFGPEQRIVSIPSWRVQDIDTPEDWKRAELIFQALIKS
jgi:N-acylneuraminate cytidylyltransferase